MSSPFNRLTIVISDAAVYIDNVGYSDLDLSQCNIPENVWALQWENNEGWIEFKGNEENELISELPVWVQPCMDKFWEFDEFLKQPPLPPIPEEIREYNKANARHLLLISDWALLGDIKIANLEEILAYRVQVRDIFFNPPDTTIENWPVMPEVVWL